MAKEEVKKELSAFEAELQPLQKEVITFQERAEALVIETDEDYEKAGEMAVVVNEKSKAIEKMRKFFVDPLNAQVKSINGVFNPQIDEADTIVKTKRLQDIRDKANAKRAEAGKEAIAEPVKEVAPVARTVTTGMAQTTVRKTWEHEIISMSELPADVQKAIFAEAYKKGIVGQVVQKFVDAGIREMTGVRIYEKSTVVLKKGTN